MPFKYSRVDQAQRIHQQPIQVEPLRLFHPTCYGLLLLIFSHTLIAAEDDDFWLMLEEPADSSVYISSGVDTDGGLSLSLHLDQALNEQLHFNGSWSQLNLSENTRSLSLGLSGDPYASWLWSYRFLVWGEPDIIESRDHELQLQYVNGSWNGLLGWQQGDANLQFSRPLNNGQTSGSVDHNALIIGLGYGGRDFDWQIESIHHDYNKDLSRLSSSRLLALIIEPSALQQSTALNSRQNRFTLGLNGKSHRFSAEYSHIRSAVTGQTSDFLNLSVQTDLSRLQQLGVYFIMPLGGGVSSLGVSLLQRW